MTDDAWHLGRTRPRSPVSSVGRMAGSRRISDKEVKNILQQMQEGVEKPKPKVLFEIGEAVRVRGRAVHRLSWHGRGRQLDKSKLRVS